MGRQKKIKHIHLENKHEVHMSEEKGLAVIEDEKVDTSSHLNELELLQQEIDKARVELEQTKTQIEEKKHELTLNTRRDHTEEERAISEKQITSINKKASVAEEISKQKAYDNVKVTGKFINRRNPGQPVKLTYMKYVDDPVKWWPFEDGKIYTIPRGFADQIRDYYHTPKFVQKHTEMDPDRPTSSIHEVDTSHKKYDFVPLSF